MIYVITALLESYNVNVLNWIAGLYYYGFLVNLILVIQIVYPSSILYCALGVVAELSKVLPAVPWTLMV